MNYNVVVIGGGLGGLTAGAKLSKEGQKVLLIERHNQVGGCATVFKRKGYTVEGALHMMDGLDNDDYKRIMFDDLSVFDKLEFVKANEFHRFSNGRVDLVIPFGIDNAIAALVEKFPDEADGIRKYFQTLLSIRKSVLALPKEKWKFLAQLPVFPLLYPGVVLNTFETVGSLLDSLFKNEDLKLALIANLMYYHADPYKMSLIFWAFAQTSYIIGGGHFIKGGGQALSGHLASVITAGGGEVLTRHHVSEIIVKDKRAVGVRYQRVSGEGGLTEEAYADVIISNAAIPTMVNKMAPDAFPARYRKKVNSMRIANSMSTLFIGFKKPMREIWDGRYSTFFLDEKVRSLSQFYNSPQRYELGKGFVFVDYSYIDNQLGDKGDNLGVIVTVDHLSNWEGLVENEYKSKKEEVTAALVDKIDQRVPGLKANVDYTELATPLSIKKLFDNPEGSVYGFAQDPMQAGIFRPTFRSPIEGLYYASAWIFPGGGFSGAIYGGYTCAEEVLNKGKMSGVSLQVG